jgi:hypothetical protein
MGKVFDLAEYTLKPTKTEKTKAKRIAGKFLKLPLRWEAQLRLATAISTYRLALLILLLDFETFGRKVRLTNVVCAENGITRNEKRHALPELEALDLVQVERRHKCAPVITLVR